MRGGAGLLQKVLVLNAPAASRVPETKGARARCRTAWLRMLLFVGGGGGGAEYRSRNIFGKLVAVAVLGELGGWGMGWENFHWGSSMTFKFCLLCVYISCIYIYIFKNPPAFARGEQRELGTRTKGALEAWRWGHCS